MERPQCRHLLLPRFLITNGLRSSGKTSRLPPASLLRETLRLVSATKWGSWRPTNLAPAESKRCTLGAEPGTAAAWRLDSLAITGLEASSIFAWSTSIVFGPVCSAGRSLDSPPVLLREPYSGPPLAFFEYELGSPFMPIASRTSCDARRPARSAPAPAEGEQSSFGAEPGSAAGSRGRAILRKMRSFYRASMIYNR